LQLLINSPPFLNLFKEFGDLMGQRGAGVPETGGGTTPLVDATVRFFKEFMVDESASTQRQSQPATGRTSRAADEEKKDNNVTDSFEPVYLYDAMKEKRHLRPLLVRSPAHVAAPCCWFVYRTANSTMRKSFFVYTLTLSTKSFPRYSLVTSLLVLHLI
jgi:hypothetical protein